MQLSYQLTEEDLLEAQIAHAGRISFRLSQFVGAACLAVGIGVVVFAGAHYYQALAPVFIGLVLVFRLHLSARLSFKRDFAGLGQVDVATSDSGIQFLSARGSSSANWSALTRYAETKHLFMLYPQSNIFNIVPKRALTPGNVMELRELLRQNLASRSASHTKRSKAKLIAFLTVCVVVAILLSVVLLRSR